MSQVLINAPKIKKVVFLGSLVIGVLFVLHVIKYDFVADDAFITLRYARNLSRGEGLVFNPGERVEGFSSLLWTLITAIPAFLGIHQLVTARLMGLMAGLMTLVLSYKLFVSVSSNQYSRIFGLIPTLVIASNGSFAAWAASGMETSLYSCLIVGTILAIVQDNLVWSTLLMVLCILVRPEGVLIFLTGSLFKIYEFNKSNQKSKRSLLIWLIVGFGTLLILTLFRYFYFGDFLPNTYYAKTGAGLAQVSQGFRYLIHYASDHEGILFMLVSILFFLSLGKPKERFISFNVLLLWSATVWVGGDGLPMYRFALAALPLLSVLEVLLLQKIYEFLIKIHNNNINVVKFILIILVLVWLFVNFSVPNISPYYGLYKYQKTVEIPRWTLVGQWFRKNAKRSDSIALVPIGAVGYYSDLVIYDMLGLTDKHIARRQMLNPQLQASMPGHGKYDGQYILSRKPTYLLLGNIDVTETPRNPTNIPFIPYYVSSIYEREKDIYDTNILIERYLPRSVLIAPNQYLNFYELKPEWREQDK